MIRINRFTTTSTSGIIRQLRLLVGFIRVIRVIGVTTVTRFLLQLRLLVEESNGVVVREKRRLLGT